MLELVAPSHRSFAVPPRRFDKQMRAANACLAALALADDPDLAADLVAMWIIGRKRDVEKLIRQIEQRVEQQQQARPASPPPSEQEEPSPLPFEALELVLGRFGDRIEANAMITLLLGRDVGSYRKTLNLLRREDQRAHDNIIGGRIRAALDSVTDDVRPQTARRIRDAAAAQCRLLIAMKAIENADALRVLAMRPIGNAHLPTASWPVLSRLYNETQLQPAPLISAYAKPLAGKEAKRVNQSDDLTLAFLKSKSLLPNAPLAHSITSIAIKTRATLADRDVALAK